MHWVRLERVKTYVTTTDFWPDENAEKISVLHKSQSALFGWTSLIFGSSGFSPSIRYWNCSSVSSAASCSVLGHVRDPSSKRLYRSRNPSPIQSRPLIRSDLLPQKRKRVPFSKGFWWYLSPMIMDSPSMPFLRSTYPQASTTLRIPAASLSMTDHLEDPVKQGFRNIVRYRNG